VYIEVRPGLVMAVRLVIEYPNFFMVDWVAAS
jgi:hypothetical protein